MEYFTLLSEGITPEVAVLIRAALLGALVFGLEALSNASRTGRKEVDRAKHAYKGQRPKKRIVRA